MLQWECNTLPHSYHPLLQTLETEFWKTSCFAQGSLCFANLVLKEVISTLSFHELCVHTHVEKENFERNSSLEYYPTNEIGEQNIRANKNTV